VVIDAQGIVEIDGENAGRLADLNRQKHIDETRAIGPAQKRKRCTTCGHPGHNARSCRSRIIIQSRIHADDLTERILDGEWKPIRVELPEGD